MNEQNKHAALTIAQQYPPAQYNLLVPMQTVTEIADIQKPVMNSVKISTDLNDGEIYEMEKAKDEWRDSKGYVHKATPAKYALTKKGLTNSCELQASRFFPAARSSRPPARSARRSTAASESRFAAEAAPTRTSSTRSESASRSSPARTSPSSPIRKLRWMM